jgi:hypothetical protein
VEEKVEVVDKVVEMVGRSGRSGRGVFYEAKGPREVMY